MFRQSRQAKAVMLFHLAGFLLVSCWFLAGFLPVSLQDRPMKHAFDLWWQWAEKPLDSMLMIDADEGLPGSS
jgi:hypothetical protein